MCRMEGGGSTHLTPPPPTLPTLLTHTQQEAENSQGDVCRRSRRLAVTVNAGERRQGECGDIKGGNLSLYLTPVPSVNHLKPKPDDIQRGHW